MRARTEKNEEKSRIKKNKMEINRKTGSPSEKSELRAKIVFVGGGDVEIEYSNILAISFFLDKQFVLSCVLFSYTFVIGFLIRLLNVLFFYKHAQTLRRIYKVFL